MNVYHILHGFVVYEWKYLVLPTLDWTQQGLKDMQKLAWSTRKRYPTNQLTDPDIDNTKKDAGR